jgi:predicted DNA-binding transcriptional regulator
MIIKSITMNTFIKNELVIFRSACKGYDTIHDIGRSVSIPEITVRRALKSLQKKGLISDLGGRPKRYMPSSSVHAEALKGYVLSTEHPIDGIVGAKLSMLLSISSNDKDLARVAKESGLMPSSARVIAWELASLGMLALRRGQLKIPQPDVRLVSFAKEYARGLALFTMRSMAKEGVMLWNEGLQFLYSSPSIDDERSAVPTGISTFADHGIFLIAKTGYYYHALWEQDLRLEDHVLHCLLVAPGESRSVLYSALVLARNEFDEGYLLHEANVYGVLPLARDVIRLSQGVEAKGLKMPPLEEMEEMKREYGVS